MQVFYREYDMQVFYHVPLIRLLIIRRLQNEPVFLIHRENQTFSSLTSGPISFEISMDRTLVVEKVCF